MAMLNFVPAGFRSLSSRASVRGYTSAAIGKPMNGVARRALRRGLTLVEMLVSLVCVILLMLAYTQLFAEVGARINDARGAIDMTNRLRSAAQRLRDDLKGLTVEVLPWQRPESGAGYFQIIEGIFSDPPPPTSGTYRNNGNVNDPATTDIDESAFPIGDTDDGMMFTVRSKNAPFTGKFAGSTVQSEVAEVVWFLRPTVQPDPVNSSNPALPTSPPTYTLYRRAFLVVPTYAGNPTTFTGVTLPVSPSLIPPRNFYDVYDISTRVEGGRFVANTLADLTKRECRYGHEVSDTSPFGFPHAVNSNWMLPFGVTYTAPDYILDTSHPRYGEDVVLTNVLAFDVQVWDPTAPIYVTGTAPNQIAVTPGDPGFASASAPNLSGSPPNMIYNAASGLGAYVDLNWLNRAFGDVRGVEFPSGTIVPMSPFYSSGNAESQLVASSATYDTWSFHYEHDGINQDRDEFTDEGTDGFDNPYNNSGMNPDPTANSTGGTSAYAGGVDDPTERETSPPYPVPMRGIKVKILVYEPDTRQIREVSVVHSFVPE